MGKRILNNSSYLIWGAFALFLGVMIVGIPGGTGAGIVLLLFGGWNIIGSVAEIRGVNGRQIQMLNVLKGSMFLVIGLLLLVGVMGRDTIMIVVGIAALLYGGWAIFTNVGGSAQMGRDTK